MNDFLTSYMQSLQGIPVLSTEEEYALADRIQGGDTTAVEVLVRHNLRFVVYTVKRLPAWNHAPIPQEDLIGMGNEALFKAACKWKPINGAKFATYARKFILRSVERGLDNTANTIRIPIKVREEIRKMMYNERKLTNVLGRPPAPAELASVLGKDVSRVNQLKFFMAQEPTSLDAISQDQIEDENEHD